MIAKPGESWAAPTVAVLGELRLDAEAATCVVRGRLKQLARGLGFDDVQATRLAAVTSEVARALNCRSQALQLVVALERRIQNLTLRLELNACGVRELLPVLDRFFDQISCTGPDRCVCRVTSSLPTELEAATLDRLREALHRKTRAELVADLEQHNRALELHRSQLEDTVQQRTGELRAAMARAEDANRAKSEFLSHMSHELRTPLNGVLGHAQILLRDGEATPHQRKSLSAIDSSGRHLLTLINDILDLSKIEAGEIEIEEAPCDLSALTLDVCNIVQPRADKRRVEVRRLLGPEVPRWVRTDTTKLRQCLVNIAGNAAKFTERGHIELRVNRNGDRLLFAIEDTGVGMSPDELEELFQPFKQTKSGRSAGGTGLGLAISHRLVHMLGGDLHVESEVGRGTTFTIELPCVAEHTGSDRPSVSPLDVSGLRLAEGQQCDVLVVDDNEVNREVLVGLLGPLGFGVSQASDGQEALETMQRKAFDLVLMDLRMPRMRGEEALAHIRKDAHLAHTKVMAVTASMESTLMAQLESLGFDGVLGKPFVASVLLGKVQELTGVKWAERRPTSRPPNALAPPSTQATLTASQAQQLLPELRQAILVGDLQRIAQQAAELDADVPALSAWGQRVQALCEGFDLPGLDAICRELEELAAAG